jgi:hypothetical protein
MGFREAFPDLNFWGAADLIAEGDYVVGRWEGGGTHTGPVFSDFLAGSLPILSPVSRDRMRDPLSQVAVRIDEHHTAALRDVLHDERLKKRRLARPSFPDHVHMRKPIGLLHADRNSFIPKVCTSEKRGRLVGMRCHAGQSNPFDMRDQDAALCPIRHVYDPSAAPFNRNRLSAFPSSSWVTAKALKSGSPIAQYLFCEMMS